MRCYELQAFGLDGLVAKERPQPAVSAGEVRIRVRATSLNYRDWLMVSGLYNPKQRLPLIPLSDGAGEVDAVGEGVSRVRVGDRVAAIFSQRWLTGPPSMERLRAAMGGPLDGMHCEYRVLSEEGVVRIPDHLSFEEAAALPCAGVTAWNAIVEGGNVRPGDTVLVQGTGGVSIFALQFARMCGARVIVTSSSDAKIERARALGAEEGINYRTSPEWEKQARVLTGGVGVDQVVEVGGAGTIGKSLRAVRTGGTISMIGVLGGNATETSLIPILMQSLRIQGVTVGNRDMFERMNQALSLHGLKPMVDRSFGFDEICTALEYLRGGSHFGKVVLRIG